MKVHFEETINKPAAEVFSAIVDKNKIVNYFCSSSDADIIEGRKVNWEFADAGAKAQIEVLKVIDNREISFMWAATGKPTVAKIELVSEGNSTRVKITEGEWELSEENAEYAMGQTSGWTDFFNCLKAYLLFNVNLRSGTRLLDRTAVRSNNDANEETHKS